jgi:hypothetical protein
MFYVGQKVVCIDPIDVLKKDSTYTITGIAVCKCCGITAIGVGIKNSRFYLVSECANCGFGEPCSGIEKEEMTYKSSRFAPLETYRESYSIAIELVQQMEQVDKQKIFNPKKETV